MSKIQTLAINDKPRFKVLGQFDESVLEIDYDSNGFIYEIRVYSEYFGGMVPTSEKWLQNNFPKMLSTLYTAVRNETGEPEPKIKEFSQDDNSPNPPPPRAA